MSNRVVSSINWWEITLEARDLDTKLLSAPESNNTLARYWFRWNVPVTMFGSWHEKLLTLAAGCFQCWPFVLKFPVAMGKYQFSSFKPADEANSAFCTFKIERLAVHKLFVATISAYKSFSLSGVPIGVSVFAPAGILCLPQSRRKHYQQLVS
ncbi:hypothetical protein Tco_0937403 [Tanacetum coccineum]|uniref:Uncharacterized protein n=1 Tax=Tanacetum coccineum TaxID=301880 RepID=A0ABQ5DF42_9ASTR